MRKQNADNVWTPVQTRDLQRILASYFPLALGPIVFLKAYDFLKFYSLICLFICFYVDECFACTFYLYVTCVPDVRKGQKRALGLLGLALQMVIRLPKNTKLSLWHPKSINQIQYYSISCSTTYLTSSSRGPLTSWNLLGYLSQLSSQWGLSYPPTAGTSHLPTTSPFIFSTGLLLISLHFAHVFLWDLCQLSTWVFYSSVSLPGFHELFPDVGGPSVYVLLSLVK